MERERFTTTIDRKLLEDIKILAVKMKCSANDLIEEAITMLLQKHKEEPKNQQLIRKSSK